MEERCEKCKYYHKLKHNFKVGEGFEESHCCTLWTEIEPKSETSWVQEVGPYSMCEMYDEKK